MFLKFFYDISKGIYSVAALDALSTFCPDPPSGTTTDANLISLAAPENLSLWGLSLSQLWTCSTVLGAQLTESLRSCSVRTNPHPPLEPPDTPPRRITQLCVLYFYVFSMVFLYIYICISMQYNPHPPLGPPDTPPRRIIFCHFGTEQMQLCTNKPITGQNGVHLVRDISPLCFCRRIALLFSLHIPFYKMNSDNHLIKPVKAKSYSLRYESSTLILYKELSSSIFQV